MAQANPAGMPDFYVPRNLLKYVQADAVHTHDITVGDSVLFHHQQQPERSRLVTLRGRVNEVLAGGDVAPLDADIASLEKAIRQGLSAMQAHAATTGEDQVLLEQSIEAYQWVLEGLDQIRLHSEMAMVEGLGLVERALVRIDELLSAPPSGPSVDIPM